jgi:hypothetical protein
MSSLLLLLVSGCYTVPRQTRLMEQETVITVSAEELSIRVQALAIPFSGMIEDAADEIMAKSSDENVRLQALLWKMNGIPILYAAVFQPDPAVAFLDVWAFIAQMVQYFGEGLGKDGLGKYHVIALDAARRMETRIMEMGRSVTDAPELSKPRALVHSWAAEHPIQSPLFYRESVVKEFADLIAEPGLSALGAVSRVSLGLEYFATWLGVYSEHLPRQARWQVELLVKQANAEGGIEVSVEQLAKLTEPLENVIAVVEKSPDLISRERVALLKALREERVATLESIDQQRVATLESIDVQRVSTLDWLTQERIVTIAALRQERVDATKDIEAISNRIVETGLLSTEGLIDHFFLRTAQLLGGLLIICVVIGIFAVRYLKKKNQN